MARPDCHECYKNEKECSNSHAIVIPSLMSNNLDYSIFEEKSTDPRNILNI